MVLDRGCVRWGEAVSDLAFGLRAFAAGDACGEFCSQVLPQDLPRRTLRDGVGEENFVDPLVEDDL